MPGGGGGGGFLDGVKAELRFQPGDVLRGRGDPVPGSGVGDGGGSAAASSGDGGDGGGGAGGGEEGGEGGKEDEEEEGGGTGHKDEEDGDADAIGRGRSHGRVGGGREDWRFKDAGGGGGVLPPRCSTAGPLPWAHQCVRQHQHRLKGFGAVIHGHSVGGPSWF